MDLGTSLRQARERAGLSVADLFGRTKIPIKTLSAIEENDFAAVPGGGVFTRSFIRSYAQEVGLDPAEAVAAYAAATQPPEPEPEPEAETSRKAPARSAPREYAREFAETPAWSYAGVAVLLLVAFITFSRFNGSGQERETVPVTAAAAEPQVAPQETVATTGSEIQIDMQARDLCWVHVVVDGETAFARLMQPGERQTVTGQRDVVLRVGNPDAFAYTVNGKAGQPLGVPKKPVTVRIGPGGQLTRAS
jgi:cytoskeletal protein RodZ